MGRQQLDNKETSAAELAKQIAQLIQENEELGIAEGELLIDELEGTPLSQNGVA